MAVIIKKDEKIKATIQTLPNNFSQQDFVEKFKELYPKDWTKLEKTYADHIRHAKPGKPVPMPKPEQYLKNALNVWNKSNM
jgi:hypothetical protein